MANDVWTPLLTAFNLFELRMQVESLLDKLLGRHSHHLGLQELALQMALLRWNRFQKFILKALKQRDHVLAGHVPLYSYKLFVDRWCNHVHRLYLGVA